MKRMIIVTLLCLGLPGCAVVGIGIAGIAADNVAQGDGSYTNQALDFTCEQTADSTRQADGSCPRR